MEGERGCCDVALIRLLPRCPSVALAVHRATIMLQSNTHGSRVIVLGVALLLLVVVVALPRVVAAEKRVHIVFATYHYTGHVVPMMALAKELATKHRDARVSFATTDVRLTSSSIIVGYRYRWQRRSSTA